MKMFSLRNGWGSVWVWKALVAGFGVSAMLAQSSRPLTGIAIKITVTDGAELSRSTALAVSTAQFTEYLLDLGTQGPGAVVGLRSWIDYDNDGRLDILVSGNVWEGAPLGVWNRIARNHGDGTFSLADIGILNFAADRVAWGDFDNDGRLDLLVGDYFGSTRLYRNVGGGAFTELESRLATVGTPEVVDVDRDGFLDLRAFGYFYSNDVPYTLTCLYHNSGSGAFTELPATVSPGLPAARPVLGDCEADGIADLAEFSGGRIGVYHGTADGQFTNLIFQTSAPAVTHLGWGDYDDDGTLDLFASDGFFIGGASGFSYWRLFHNQNDITNTPPQPPTALVATVLTNDRVVLRWSMAQDAETTNAAALTYELRIGTSPGGIQVAAPPADPVTGRRRLPQPGTLTTNRAVLQHLPRGIYYWGVQAIDAGHAGSPFAPEAIFTYFHPTILALSNLVLYPGAGPGTVSVTVGDADSAAESLVLAGFSSNTNLVLSTNIVFGGAGSNRTVTVIPTHGIVGTSVVTVVVTAIAGLTASNSFRLEVNYLSDVTPVFSGSNYFNARWADYDNDGNLDLLLSGYGNNGLPVARIYRNYPAGSTNHPPAAPGGLSAVVAGKSGRLSWTAATDQNQANGLTYNIRVGSAPGLGDVVSPMAGTDGWRRVPALGNANHRLSWTVTHLTGGTFYWSVQAIDASFAGSSFADEWTFTVTNGAPTALTQSVATPEDTNLAISLTGSDPDLDPLTFSIVSPPLFGRLIGNPPAVTYQPDTNCFGFDQFTYAANDRTTSSPPATVWITVIPVWDVAGAVLALQATPGSSARLQLQGEPWQSYRIEASDDLVHWVLLTNVLATNLLMQLVDADAPNFPRRFYRAAELAIAPAFGFPPPSSDGPFPLVITGEPGRNYQIQSSTDLSSWSVVTNVLMTSPTVLWVDANARHYPSLFYRLVLISSRRQVTP